MKPLPTLVAAVLLVIAVGLWSFPDQVREYRLYLTQNRPDLDLRLEDISQDWTERDLIRQLSHLRFRCADNAPVEYIDDRSCFADIDAFNGKPAMGLAVYLKTGRVDHVGISIPWWSHSPTYLYLRENYGPPHASQLAPSAGVRLSGWKLPNESAVFFNRERPLNPLSWNLMLWTSERACSKTGCLRVPPR